MKIMCLAPQKKGKEKKSSFPNFFLAQYPHPPTQPPLFFSEHTAATPKFTFFLKLNSDLYILLLFYVVVLYSLIF